MTAKVILVGLCIIFCSIGGIAVGKEDEDSVFGSLLAIGGAVLGIASIFL